MIPSHSPDAPRPAPAPGAPGAPGAGPAGLLGLCAGVRCARAGLRPGAPDVVLFFDPAGRPSAPDGPREIPWAPVSRPLLDALARHGRGLLAVPVHFGVGGLPAGTALLGGGGPAAPAFRPSRSSRRGNVYFGGIPRREYYPFLNQDGVGVGELSRVCRSPEAVSRALAGLLVRRLRSGGRLFCWLLSAGGRLACLLGDGTLLDLGPSRLASGTELGRRLAGRPPERASLRLTQGGLILATPRGPGGAPCGRAAALPRDALAHARMADARVLANTLLLTRLTGGSAFDCWRSHLPCLMWEEGGHLLEVAGARRQAWRLSRLLRDVGYRAPGLRGGRAPAAPGSAVAAGSAWPSPGAAEAPEATAGSAVEVACASGTAGAASGAPGTAGAVPDAPESAGEVPGESWPAEAVPGVPGTAAEAPEASGSAVEASGASGPAEAAPDAPETAGADHSASESAGEAPAASWPAEATPDSPRTSAEATQAPEASGSAVEASGASEPAEAASG
ncbi:MAG: hypothetical protein LBG06_12350, partial [Deltaproteobacteria bacterium]|nr:hypothetical protein [Deltaproteobacteria bacterium]